MAAALSPSGGGHGHSPFFGGQGDQEGAEIRAVAAAETPTGPVGGGDAMADAAGSGLLERFLGTRVVFATGIGATTDSGGHGQLKS